jgi:hypothetical protein
MGPWCDTFGPDKPNSRQGLLRSPLANNLKATFQGASDQSLFRSRGCALEEEEGLVSEGRSGGFWLLFTLKIQ